MKCCLAVALCIAALTSWVGCGEITCEDERSCPGRSNDGGRSDASDSGDASPDQSVDVSQGDSDGAIVEKGDAEAGADSPGPAADGDAPLEDTGIVAPPRLIGPLSTSVVTSQQPQLRWVLAPDTSGAHVQICRDRACTNIALEFDATGSSGAPPSTLQPGVLFWRAFGIVGGKRGQTATPTWQFTASGRSAPVNTSWGSTVDVNGDGYADVIVSAQGQGNRGSGRVYVYQGGASGLPTTPALTLRSPVTNPDGGIVGEAFGTYVGSAGDVNGDGYGDIIVGDYWVQTSGRAYLYLGSASGLSNTPAVTLQPPLGPDGGADFEFFGNGAAGAGDINGDGYADVIVGAYGSNRAYVFEGGASGLSNTPALIFRLPPDDSGAALGQFGFFVSTAGDVDGDGYADVIVGAPADVGRAYVYRGSASGLSNLPTVILQPPGGGSGGDAFGFSVASAGDLNADGYADVIVGARGAAGRGRAYAYLGSSSGISSATVVTLQPPGDVDSGASSDNFGISVAGAGDVNNDGYADVIVGAWHANGDTGAAYVYSGSSSGLAGSTGVPLQRTDAVALDMFGVSVAGAGDINHDGYADVVVGAWQANNKAGRAYVYSGGSGTLGLMPSITLDRPAVAGDGGVGTPLYYGSSVASLEPRNRDRSSASRSAIMGPRFDLGRPWSLSGVGGT